MQLSGGSVLRRYPLTVSVANPAAGADWTATVPAGRRWHVQSVIGTLTTSIAAANRRPRLLVTDGLVTLVAVPSGVAETASLAWVNVWGDGLVSTNDGLYVSQGMPDMYLAAGAQIKTSTAAIDTADQWSGVYVFVTEEMIGRGAESIDRYEDVEIAGIAPSLIG